MTPLPKRRRHPKMGLRKPSQIRCPSHLKWIRGHFCIVSGKINHVCWGKIEAAHVRKETDGGVGVKPSDVWAIPLCASAHRQQHNMGEPAFEKLWKINLKEIAEGLAARSPALRKRAKVLAR